MKVLLLENIHKSAENYFKKKKYEFEVYKDSLDENELIEKLKGVEILGIRSKTQVTQKVIENAKDLCAIGAFCIGTNQIDINASDKYGIVTFEYCYVVAVLSDVLTFNHEKTKKVQEELKCILEISFFLYSYQR